MIFIASHKIQKRRIYFFFFGLWFISGNQPKHGVKFNVKVKAVLKNELNFGISQ